MEQDTTIPHSAHRGTPGNIDGKRGGVCHNSRDSTKIEGREKAVKKPKKEVKKGAKEEAKPKKLRGRWRNGDYSEQWFIALPLNISVVT